MALTCDERRLRLLHALAVLAVALAEAESRGEARGRASQERRHVHGDVAGLRQAVLGLLRLRRGRLGFVDDDLRAVLTLGL